MVKQSSMNTYLTAKTGKELLKRAIELWKNDGLWDNYDGEKESIGKAYTDSDENRLLVNMENDPVINLFMTALAYQTNGLKKQISDLQSSLLDEFIRKTIPYHLTRPNPAITIMRTRISDNDSYCCEIDDTTIITLEKRNKTKMRFKEAEKFSFIPLLKTKVINATITDVKKIAHNLFEVLIAGENCIENLSGISLYFPRIKTTSISVSINEHAITTTSMRDFERLPLCPLFEVNQQLFNQSLMYGTTEAWLDLTAQFADHLFYIAPYTGRHSTNRIKLTIEFDTLEDVELSPEEIILNCFPIVNVERCDTTLTKEEPIKKIAIESDIKQDGNNSGKNQTGTGKQKYFISIIPPSSGDFEYRHLTLRRFGAERFHIGELVELTRTLINKYSSDFYAFSTFADASFDDKINNLRNRLNEIGQIVEINAQNPPGVYLMLKKENNEYPHLPTPRIKVSYLLTDGKRGNDISPDCTIGVPSILDAHQSSILMSSYGGRDEVMDEIRLKNIAQYYHLTKDRLITRSDIKYFCVKELIQNWHFTNENINTIFILPEFSHGQQLIHIRIELMPQKDQKIDETLFEKIENDMEQKIRIRSNVFNTCTVHLEII